MKTIMERTKQVKIMKRIFTLIIGLVLILAFTVSAHATLMDMGNGTIYDTDLNLTWLKDAGMGGVKTWSDAVNWADNLVYAGFSDWRLPTTDPDCGVGYNCTGSEMGHLHYTELGNPAAGGLIYTSPFSNLQPFGYWSGTEDASNPNYMAWFFNFFLGHQDAPSKDGLFYAWAVRSNVSPLSAVSVPEPGTLMLLGSGLAGIVAWRKRLE